jgi:hypothetical protein
MPQDMSNINPDLLARLERHRGYKDVFVRQYAEKKKDQRMAARIRSREPNIAIGVAGEMNIVSPSELRNIRQRELQDVFGPQQSSQLSKKIKQDKLLGTQKARAQADRLKAQQAAQRVTQPKTVSSSGAKKTQSTVKSGKRVVRSEPIYINPVTRQREVKAKFAGNKKGRLKPGTTREGSIDTLRIAGFEVSINGVPVRSDLYMPTIDAPKYEAYGSISDGSMKKTGMSHGEAVDYISKRVDIDGGTLARNKNLPGFGQGVKDIVDQGILSKDEVSKVVQSKNILELTPNAGQVADTLDLEELYRLSYGQALSASQQGVGMGKGEQIKIGRAIGLGEKQTMMVDHENLVKGHNAALKELYDADRAQKIADGARNQQNIQATKLADKEQRIAAENLAKAERKTAERIHATINRGSSEVGETILHSPMAPAAEQAKEVIRKAPISKRTMEKMMSSNMLAAGVAAGGLGLLYASNKIRGEREVGR